MNPRRIAAVAVLACAATACAGAADSNTIAGAIREEKQARRVKAIKPPPAPDATRTGRVGLLLDTNSAGWQRTLETPAQAGAVILFVSPRSPAAKAQLARGDLIVQVGPTRVRNDERARVALRGRPGVALTVRVVRKTKRVDVTVVPSTVTDTNLVPIYDAMLRKDPRDPTTLLLRAQATTDPQIAISYLNRALEAQEMVEAYAHRARLFWDESQRVENEAVALGDQRRAREDFDHALRIDPRAATVFVSRGNAFVGTQSFTDAERDALRAVAIDATLPGAYLLLASTRLQ